MPRDTTGYCGEHPGETTENYFGEVLGRVSRGLLECPHYRVLVQHATQQASSKQISDFINFILIFSKFRSKGSRHTIF